MNNFTKSIVYSGVVLAAGLVAIFAIYNNMQTQSPASIEPAAGQESSTMAPTPAPTSDASGATQTPGGTPAPGAAMAPAADASAPAATDAAKQATDAAAQAAQGADKAADSAKDAQKAADDAAKAATNAAGAASDANKAAAGEPATAKPAEPSAGTETTPAPDSSKAQ